MHDASLFNLRRAVGLLLLTGFLVGCSAVEEAHFDANYDKNEIKRVGVYASHLPGAPHALMELMTRMAREYMNQKKEFLIYEVGRAPYPFDVASKHEKIDGAVHLQPRGLCVEEGSLRFQIMARLIRKDGTVAWWARASDTETTDNVDLERMTAIWTDRIGEEVEPYVAPLFILYQDLFAELPTPELTSDEIDEKIELEIEAE